ncbi:hypothetical protein EMIHUDRAFT_358994, partial [Emiliania huxleyi CCMP1516]|uniref:RanBP2-type domain-containing protein n=2 Tax=Emiliania huxleyi TaxID=2903 RepID=A0A0D3IA74_EMIH1
MDDRAETQRIEERFPQGTDEWLARPRLSTTFARNDHAGGNTAAAVRAGRRRGDVHRAVAADGSSAGKGALTQDERRGDVGPTRANKTRRMDRRLTHWQCIYCRRETRNDARATRCWNCDGEKEQLRDADSEGREAARRGQRAKEYAGRSLNALGAGTSLVPRAAQGVFERARLE